MVQVSYEFSLDQIIEVKISLDSAEQHGIIEVPRTYTKILMSYESGKGSIKSLYNIFIFSTLPVLGRLDATSKSRTGSRSNVATHDFFFTLKKYIFAFFLH
jgi:hypothetical protein